MLKRIVWPDGSSRPDAFSENLVGDFQPCGSTVSAIERK
jgi:hypothetical protein